MKADHLSSFKSRRLCQRSIKWHVFIFVPKHICIAKYSCRNAKMTNLWLQLANAFLLLNFGSRFPNLRHEHEHYLNYLFFFLGNGQRSTVRKARVSWYGKTTALSRGAEPSMNTTEVSYEAAMIDFHSCVLKLKWSVLTNIHIQIIKYMFQVQLWWTSYECYLIVFLLLVSPFWKNVLFT